MTRTGVVALLGLTQTLAWGSTYYLPAILARPMAADLGLSPSDVFLALSLALGIAALCGPAAGRWIDRRGGRGILSLSSLGFALGLGLLGLAQGQIGFWLAWAVIGLAMGIGLYEAAFATATGIYGASARSAITGITLIAGLASTVAWPISAGVEAAWGWRAACLVWAGAHLAFGLPLIRLVPHGVQPPAAAAAPGAAGRPAAGIVVLGLVFATAGFTSTAIGAHLPALLQVMGASAAGAVFAAALLGPAQVAARLLEFGLLQRLHPLWSARLAAAAHPIAAAGLVGFGAPAAIGFALLHGAGSGMITISKGTLPLALYGASGYGFRTGVLLVPARFAQAAAPWAFALMLGHWGAGALVATALIGLAGLGGLLWLSPRAQGG